MKPNPTIGTVPCPIPKCARSCDVRKFAPRHTRDTGKRRAGKMYFDCPDHGRFGFDARPALQEYILEHGKIEGATREEQRAEVQRAAEPIDVKTPPAPAAQPAAAPAPAKPPKQGWGYF